MAAGPSGVVCDEKEEETVGSILPGLLAAQLLATPPVTLDPQELNLGTVREGAVAEGRVTFRNRTRHLLRIGATASCDCLRAVPSRVEIPAGASRRVSLRLDSAGRRGYLEASAAFDAEGLAWAHTVTVRAVIETVAAAGRPIRPLSPLEAYEALRSTTAPLTVDVREPAEYDAGHLPGSLGIRGAQLERHLGFLARVRRDRPLLLVGSGGGPQVDAVTQASARVTSAAVALQGWGFQEVQALRGGLAAWREAGYPMEQGGSATQPVRILTVDEARTAVAHPHGPLVVDARTPAEYAAGHLPGAVSVPFDRLLDRPADLPRDRDLLLYCGGDGCPASEVAAETLLRAGYDPRRLFLLEGGYPAWARRGLATEKINAVRY